MSLILTSHDIKLGIVYLYSQSVHRLTHINAHTILAGKVPTLSELLVLKYTDKGEKQELKKVRIIDKASHKWKEIASLICNDANVTTVLEQKYQNNSNECLRQVFIQYFIENKPQNYTQDWSGLIELLDDINLKTVAEEIEHALSCIYG